jgi:hypothetical protein
MSFVVKHGIENNKEGDERGAGLARLRLARSR